MPKEVTLFSDLQPTVALRCSVVDATRVKFTVKQTLEDEDAEDAGFVKRLKKAFEEEVQEQAKRVAGQLALMDRDDTLTDAKDRLEAIYLKDPRTAQDVNEAEVLVKKIIAYQEVLVDRANSLLDQVVDKARLKTAFFVFCKEEKAKKREVATKEFKVTARKVGIAVGAVLGVAGATVTAVGIAVATGGVGAALVAPAVVAAVGSGVGAAYKAYKSFKQAAEEEADVRGKLVTSLAKIHKESERQGLADARSPSDWESIEACKNAWKVITSELDSTKELIKSYGVCIIQLEKALDHKLTKLEKLAVDVEALNKAAAKSAEKEALDQIRELSKKVHRNCEKAKSLEKSMGEAKELHEAAKEQVEELEKMQYASSENVRACMAKLSSLKQGVAEAIPLGEGVFAAASGLKKFFTLT